MNFQKFTQKSIQAVNDLEKVALEYGNQEIEQEHLLYSLLTQEESLIARLISKMDIDSTLFKERVEEALNKRVKVSGGQPYIGQYLNKALSALRTKPRGWETNTSPWNICFWLCWITPAPRSRPCSGRTGSPGRNSFRPCLRSAGTRG